MTVNPLLTEPVQQLIDALNQRLETCEVYLRDFRSEGFDDDQWNGRLLLCQRLRPEFVEVIDLDHADLAQENLVLGQLERDTDAAFAWDEEGYGNDRIPEIEVSHYLLDDARLGQVLTAIQAIPVITDQQRATALHEYKIS